MAIVLSPCQTKAKLLEWVFIYDINYCLGVKLPYDSSENHVPPSKKRKITGSHQSTNPPTSFRQSKLQILASVAEGALKSQNNATSGIPEHSVQIEKVEDLVNACRTASVAIILATS